MHVLKKITLEPYQGNQPAKIELTWSGSHDGIVEDVPFTPNIQAIAAHRYIRWNCVMRANLFTGGWPRIDILEMPFLIP